MPFEVTTKVKNFSLTNPDDIVLVVTVTITPRGTGNRSKVQALARQLQADPTFAPFIRKVVKGATSVHLHLEPSFQAAAAFAQRAIRSDADVPGQMHLPLGAA